MPFALLFGAPFLNPGSEILIMVGFGLAFAIASITLTEGVKRLSAAETSLLSILEVVFAPVLAWLLLSEVPARLTFTGGALILVGVLGAQAWPRKAAAI